MTKMTKVTKKPAVPAKYLKHRIVKEGDAWFQSTLQHSGTFYWKRLSGYEDIDEEGPLEIKSKFTERTLQLILEEMRKNPDYTLTWLDRQTFYQNRINYPLIWNAYINMTHS